MLHEAGERLNSENSFCNFLVLVGQPPFWYSSVLICFSIREGIREAARRRFAFAEKVSAAANVAFSRNSAPMEDIDTSKLLPHGYLPEISMDDTFTF